MKCLAYIAKLTSHVLVSCVESQREKKPNVKSD